MRRAVIRLSVAAALVTTACSGSEADPGLTFAEAEPQLEELCAELRAGLRTTPIDTLVDVRRSQIELLANLGPVRGEDASDDDLTLVAEEDLLGELSIALSSFRSDVRRLDVTDVDLDAELAEPIEAWFDAIAAVDEARDAYGVDTAPTEPLDTASRVALDAMSSLGLADCVDAELADAANESASFAFERFVTQVAPSGDLEADLEAACRRYQLDVGLGVIDARLADPLIGARVLVASVTSASEKLLADLNRFAVPPDRIDELRAAARGLEAAFDSSPASDDVESESPLGSAEDRLNAAIAALAPGC